MFFTVLLVLLLLCGQSSVCSKIMELLGQNEIDHHKRQVAILSQDCFYRVLTPEQKARALKGQFNFDHPGTQVAGPKRVYSEAIRAVKSVCGSGSWCEARLTELLL